VAAVNLATAPRGLDRIKSVSDPDVFPHSVLAGAETALVLFCAAFYGEQDAVWIAEAGLRATCVDTDAERVQVMKRIYPPDWDFIVANVYEFVYDALLCKWDVVTVDCGSAQFDRCADLISVFCGLARRAVVLGTGFATVVLPPNGWSVTRILFRSPFRGGVYWTVLEAA
jgi:hypothetical protein